MFAASPSLVLRRPALSPRAIRHFVVWVLVTVAIALLDVAAVGVLAPNVRGLTPEASQQLEGLAGAVPSLMVTAAAIIIVAAGVALGRLPVGRAARSRSGSDPLPGREDAWTSHLAAARPTTLNRTDFGGDSRVEEHESHGSRTGIG